MSSETRLVKWNVNIIREWNPYYFLGGGRVYGDPIPPVDVSISVTFDDNDAALAFEARVREILEEMS
jgi:hypothetical protein